MNRSELLNKLKPYFNIKELVCKHVYDIHKENAWQFISTELLSTLYILRCEILKKPMIVNNWSRGGLFSQRGLRCNTCKLVKDKNRVYISAHILGKAIDFHVNGLSPEDVRTIIKNNITKLEYPIRLEEDVNWVHIDTLTVNPNVKLITFKS